MCTFWQAAGHYSADEKDSREQGYGIFTTNILKTKKKSSKQRNANVNNNSRCLPISAVKTENINKCNMQNDTTFILNSV